MPRILSLMDLDHEACYRALAAKDTRFDGLFFVGVSSTGIYCRCVCSARTPKPSNCTFYGCAAAAEKAGYRPCLVCRPEVAPGAARVDAIHHLAHSAASRIEDGALDEGSLDELAASLGVSGRHLRRAVVDAFGVSPVELAQTQRLLSAKRLLSDTNLPIGEVALASGFSSLRRFNALFLERYRKSPTQFRRRRVSDEGSVLCEVGIRLPYDWEAILAFLDARSVAGVEHVEGGVYRRTARVAGRVGWIAVRRHPSKAAITVEVSSGLVPALPQVLRRVRRLFDTACRPADVSEALGPLATPNPGLRLPGCFDACELAVRAILGQQITVKAARTLAGRVAAAFGEPIETPWPGLERLFPSADVLADVAPEQLGEMGIVRTRSRAILDIAASLRDKRIRLQPGSDPEVVAAQLQAIPGIGAWTSQYIAMRALAFPDAFPPGDVAVLKALGGVTVRQAQELAEPWRPWRSYAVMHLWKSLETPSEASPK